MSEQFPILDQLRDAADNRERIALLLRCPDVALLRHAEEMVHLLRRVNSDAGAEFVVMRWAALVAVRDEAGLLPIKIAGQLEDFRAAAAHYVAGPRAAPPP